jgi:hypothetical protein
VPAADIHDRRVAAKVVAGDDGGLCQFRDAGHGLVEERRELRFVA